MATSIGPRVLMVAFGTSVLSCASQARADDPYEVITVTAQKQEQSLESIPISVKAISDKTLEQINADGLADIVKLVPSLSMTNLQRGGNNVQIRGFGSNVASLGTVAIYNDGVISPNRIASSGTFSEQDSALYDVERVEVLRGPQGTLYGEGSFGGVINIISKLPNAQKLEASGSASWFNTNSGSSDNRDAEAMVNVPLIDNVLAVRAVGFNYNYDGYIDAVNILPPLLGAGPPEVVGHNANTEKVKGGRIAMAFTPNEDVDATLTYKSQKTQIGIGSYDSPRLIGLLNSLIGTTIDENSQAVFDPNYGSKNTTDEVVLNVNVQTGIGTLTSITGYGNVDDHNAATLDASSDAWSEELRLVSNNTGSLNWITGAYARSAHRNIHALGGSYSVDNLDQLAVFGELYWSLTPTLTATFGARYSQDKVDVTDRRNALPKESQSFNNTSPKFALDWQMAENTHGYISVAKGFRAGGVNVDQSLGTDPTFTADFDSDSIWSYEIGLKTNLFDDKVTINTAVFYADWSDIQIDRAITSVINPPVQFIVVNGDDAYSAGIETDIYIHPGDGWEIVLGGSYVQAEYDGGTIDSATAGLGVSIDGDRLPNAPEYLANASVEKSFPVGHNGTQGYVRADYSLRGSSFGDVPNDPPNGNLASGQYNLFNVRSGLRFGMWEVQLFADNVFDSHASSYNFYEPDIFTDVHALLRPRTIGINVKVNYE